jgi:hypothetical protein
MRTIIHFFANIASMVLWVARRREHLNNTPDTLRSGTIKFSPNVGAGTGFDNSSSARLSVFACFTNMFVGMVRHALSHHRMIITPFDLST